ncbi:MAG: carboxymuconolactone decarboxylase family protein [Thiotrichales bacterium]|nr:MAG: carboxymuconolactone decarboxylase family protein [Thiotrichales bacterium]
MSDYPVLTLETASDEARPVLETTRAAFGFIPNLLGVMAHSPALAEAYLTVSGLFDKSDLTPTERQVVLLTVSQYHGCHYCVAAHSTLSEMQGIAADVVAAIRNDQLIADAKLQALRVFVRAVVEKRGWLEPRDQEAFYAAGYEPHHVMDVLVGVAQKTMSNFTNHIAQTPLDDAFSAHAWNPEQRSAGHG